MNLKSEQPTTEPYKLPNGWKWVRLGEVCEVNPSRPRGFFRSPDTPTTFIPMAAVDEKSGTYKPEIVPYSKVSKGYTYFEENDVLFAKITPCMQNGKHVIAKNLIDGIGFGTTEFHVLRAKKEIIPEWIWYFIRQPCFLQEATGYFTGAVGQQRIPKEFLINYVIPLPPLEDQRRIIAKIQELMQEVERARTACEKQLEAVKALPSAYLREVFESEEAKKWERKKLGEVCKTTSGGTPHRGHIEYFYGNIPWVKSGELKDGYINDTEEKITKLGLDNSNAKVLPTGTLLIAMYGATVGKLGILEIAATTNQAICAILPNSNVLTDFLFFFFFYYRKDLINKSYGGAQPNISQELIRKTLIPMPAINDQHRIATYLNEKMAYVEKLKVSIEKQLEAINALPQAILRKAFRGEL